MTASLLSTFGLWRIVGTLITLHSQMWHLIRSNNFLNATIFSLALASEVLTVIVFFAVFVLESLPYFEYKLVIKDVRKIYLFLRPKKLWR